MIVAHTPQLDCTGGRGHDCRRIHTPFANCTIALRMLATTVFLLLLLLLYNRLQPQGQHRGVAAPLKLTHVHLFCIPLPSSFLQGEFSMLQSIALKEDNVVLMWPVLRRGYQIATGPATNRRHVIVSSMASYKTWRYLQCRDCSAPSSSSLVEWSTQSRLHTRSLRPPNTRTSLGRQTATMRL